MLQPDPGCRPTCDQLLGQAFVRVHTERLYSTLQRHAQGRKAMPSQAKASSYPLRFEEAFLKLAAG